MYIITLAGLFGLLVAAALGMEAYVGAQGDAADPSEDEEPMFSRLLVPLVVAMALILIFASR
jgi:hypothetical protein